MSKALYFVTFAAGALVGFAAAYKFAEKKFDAIYQEEIKSVREAFANKHNSDDEPVEEPTEKHKPSEEHKDEILEEYENLTKNYGAASMPPKKSAPYVITPEEFGNSDEYEVGELEYYTRSNTLVDAEDKIVANVDALIGKGSLKTVGEYADDAVYVRNEDLKMEYEIIFRDESYPS